jgi:hypothetical protein
MEKEGEEMSESVVDAMTGLYEGYETVNKNIIE